MIASRARAWVAAAGAAMLVVTASYAGLLVRARWSGDEYITLALLREGGWPAFRHWYLTWSPRLLSDLLYALYGMAVDAVHRPLAGSCMALLWAGLAAACVLPAWRCPAAQRGVRVLTGCALFCLCLTGHAVTEVFYWPGSGLSYIPTLAGMVWLFWCLADGLQNQVTAGLALTLIAGSSEVGVFLALTVAACISGSHVGWSPTGARQRRQKSFASFLQKRSASFLWLIPGTALALLDLALVLRGRVGTIEIVGLDGQYVHHAGASLIAATVQFGRELLVPDSDAGSITGLVTSVAARVLILLAARRAFGGVAPREPGLLLAFAAALLLAAFASVAAAFYQFGELCCQRHDTMRACFITLALVALGAASAAIRPGQAGRQAAPLWLAAILLLFTPNLPALAADYATIPAVLRARAQTWASGLQTGESMVFRLDPPGRLINGTGLPPGSFAMDRKPAWYNLGIMKFFHKKNLTIKPAA